MSQWFKYWPLNCTFDFYLGCIIKSTSYWFHVFPGISLHGILFDIWSKKKTDAWESSINPSYSPQWIKDKIAWTLKVLQKHYITADTAVTSEDLEANLLVLCFGGDLHPWNQEQIHPVWWKSRTQRRVTSTSSTRLLEPVEDRHPSGGSEKVHMDLENK